jgi:hypothetical protein
MIYTNLERKRFKFIDVIHSFNGITEWPMAHQNVAGVLTSRGLMDCLQYYDNCLFIFELYMRFYFFYFQAEHKILFRLRLVLFLVNQIHVALFNCIYQY